MTTTQKQAKLAGMMSRMDYRDRERFERARRNHKPDIDGDLFVASLHVPIGGGRPRRKAVQYRMTEVVATENPEQLTLGENEEEVVA